MENQLKVFENNLPANPEEQIKFHFINQEKLNAMRAKCRAATIANIPIEQYQLLMAETRRLAEEVLDSAVRIGEVTKAMEIGSGGDRKSNKIKSYNTVKFDLLKKLDLNYTDAWRFETIADHPQQVEKVKQDAREKNKIPLQTEVLELIKNVERDKFREEAAQAGKLKPLNIDFRLGDFEEVLNDIPDGSIDCIITDPPYPYEFIECWTKLSRFAAKKLKPYGFCIAYSGNMFLPEVLNRMNEYLNYYWAFCIHLPGSTNIVTPRNLMNLWKPVLIYQNQYKKLDHVFADYFVSQKPEKDMHGWQQSISGVSYLVEMFTKEGEIICEPFAGAGTTIKVAIEKKRNIVAAEIDETTFNIAKNFLHV